MRFALGGASTRSPAAVMCSPVTMTCQPACIAAPSKTRSGTRSNGASSARPVVLAGAATSPDVTGCPRTELIDRVARLPRPLVFTNGVFDLLHRGHVECLAAARREGASLVVGINGDVSVRGLGKGALRPLVPEADRAVVVAALEAVSLVVLFDEPTPAALIALLRPDVYVKGGDYRLADLPEARQVAAWGGRALTVPIVAGRSTTALVERIRRGEDTPPATGPQRGARVTAAVPVGHRPDGDGVTP